MGNEAPHASIHQTFLAHGTMTFRARASTHSTDFHFTDILAIQRIRLPLASRRLPPISTSDCGLVFWAAFPPFYCLFNNVNQPIVELGKETNQNNELTRFMCVGIACRGIGISSMWCRNKLLKSQYKGNIKLSLVSLVFISGSASVALIREVPFHFSAAAIRLLLHKEGLSRRRRLSGEGTEIGRKALLSGTAGERNSPSTL